MASDFAAGFAQGFAGTFVPAFTKYIEGARAAKGIKNVGDLVGKAIGNPGLGSGLTQAAQSALMAGADPTRIYGEMLSTATSAIRNQNSYNLGIATQNNSFKNASALTLLGGQIDAQGDARALDYLKTQTKLFDENSAREAGRGFLLEAFRAQNQNARANLEAQTRIATSGVGSTAGVGTIGLNASQARKLKKLEDALTDLQIKNSTDGVSDFQNKAAAIQSQIDSITGVGGGGTTGLGSGVSGVQQYFR